MSPTPVPGDERQLVRALTAVLQQQRQALVRDSGDGVVPAQVIWQPLIDALDAHAAQRRALAATAAPDPDLANDVAALRAETLALQHALTLWSAALSQAITQSSGRLDEPVYAVSRQGGSSYAGSSRQSLGRG